VEAMRNSYPQEIVELFEKHGFIWGGKWSHFDLMHFEYRPEVLKKWQLSLGAGSGG
jgi:peptidoglycan LD-endopeptidase CwlK